ncbi:MAG: ABC transporter permease [Gammaproteobacteria bacterium]|nr:ABC transporter permease [Gammaproteobacteria bacterium]
MRFSDIVKLTVGSVVAQRTRAYLTATGIAIGIAAVVLLTSIGEGVQRYVLEEFSQFGTNVIAINPGKKTTFGAPIGAFGTVRPLSFDDAEALRRIPYVTSSVAVMQGNASVEGNGRQRRAVVIGVGHEFIKTFRFQVALGEFLPDDDPRAARAYAVLGAKMRDELFANTNPLGARIRIGGDRYVVVGTMQAKGTMLGFDLDDTVYIPTARALELFNREGVQEIDILYAEGAPVDEVVAGIKRILIARHGGEDFTITTQQQMLDVLGDVLGVLKVAVGALGGISLLVGAVGIFTILTIAVKERTAEIGLLRALGVRRAQIRNLFLGEGLVLAAAGGAAGFAIGAGGAQLLRVAVPALPIHTPLSYVLLAEGIAVVIGLIAGVLPAHNASGLEPVEALRSE